MPTTVELTCVPWPPIRVTALPVLTASFSASACPMMIAFGARRRSLIEPSRIWEGSLETLISCFGSMPTRVTPTLPP